MHIIYFDPIHPLPLPPGSTRSPPYIMFNTHPNKSLSLILFPTYMCRAIIGTWLYVYTYMCRAALICVGLLFIGTWLT